MTNKELADLIYPDVTKTISDYEKIYPLRDLKEGAVVSRYAPSPTGFVHMGNMLACFIENFVPKQTGGAFYLRIEDTDQKREIEGGINNIIDAIKALGLSYDEGVISEDVQKGDYGPYIQSQRIEIYHTFAKYMIENDLAYPCFCTPEEIEEIRTIQKSSKERIGYYGRYAKCRNLTYDEVKAHLDNGDKWVLRLKSMGDFNKKIVFKDLIKGTIELPENEAKIAVTVPEYGETYDDPKDVELGTLMYMVGNGYISLTTEEYEKLKKYKTARNKLSHLTALSIEEIRALL